MNTVFDTPAFNERLFFPRSDTSPTPPDAVDLDVPGEAVLHVRLHRKLPDAPTLLLFHGNGEVVADYDSFAGQFATVGVNLAVVDFRGYGRSAGTPTLRNAIADAHRVFASVRPAFVMGRSLGSACAAALYGAGLPDVRGFILESGLVDTEALVRRRGLLPPSDVSAEDRATFDPVPKLERGTQPLLVLHGERDTLIIPDEARRAHAAAGTTDKTLVMVPDRGHNDISFSPLYWQALAAFVARLA